MDIGLKLLYFPYVNSLFQFIKESISFKLAAIFPSLWRVYFQRSRRLAKVNCQTATTPKNDLSSKVFKNKVAWVFDNLLFLIGNID